MSKFHRPYTRFAPLYDIMGGDRFSVRMMDYTFRLLRRFRFRPRKVLDLCCGTGTAALMFAREGYEVTGLDGSPEMLKVARAKARREGLKLRLINQRLPDFEIGGGKSGESETFDLVTCFYDSLNYLLSEDELGHCFQAVAKHLRPGGLFIFDMNCARALKFLWGGSVHAGCHSGVAWIFQSIYFDKIRQADLRATFFVKKGKMWEMFEEVHPEKAYANGVIKGLLKRVGFEVAGYYAWNKFRKPDAKTYRIAVVARRKA